MSAETTVTAPRKSTPMTPYRWALRIVMIAGSAVALASLCVWLANQVPYPDPHPARHGFAHGAALLIGIRIGPLALTAVVVALYQDIKERDKVGDWLSRIVTWLIAPFMAVLPAGAAYGLIYLLVALLIR